MGKQYTSHAVMAQRFEAKDSLDDFPTPPRASADVRFTPKSGHAQRRGRCLLSAKRGYGIWRGVEP